MIRFPALALLIMFTGSALAQSLSSTVGLLVYPANNQSKEQAEQDDYQCFKWAKEESNFNPMNTREPSEVVAQNPGADGSGARGALLGRSEGSAVGQSH